MMVKRNIPLSIQKLPQLNHFKSKTEEKEWTINNLGREYVESFNLQNISYFIGSEKANSNGSKSMFLKIYYV